ncbi:MAG: MBL fold metallo-hydrolase [Chloroflexi bacterium]|nr:MBL fold metallo-hydrolase [Chloroflexota bacterium]
MRLLFLGTGTSHGVPMIGCECAVCQSPDPHDRRCRTSALLRLGERQVLIDATAELRVQSLAFGLRRVDAVLLTHAHADHIAGMDDLRSFNLWQRAPIPIYCSPDTAASVRRAYAYIFNGDSYPGKPDLRLHEVEAPFELFDRAVTPLTVPHGERTRVTAFRLGALGYVTDASAVPAAARAGLSGLDVLVLNALRYRPHPTHLCLDEALAVIEDLRPRRAFLTHIAHDLRHAEVNAALPSHVRLAHDGLEIEVED